MECSIGLVIDFGTKAAADFVAMMWDDEQRPVTSDEVSVDLKKAFDTLEWVDPPDIKRRASDTRWLAYYDTLGTFDPLSTLNELADPYFSVGAIQIVAHVVGDEFDDYILIKPTSKKPIMAERPEDYDVFDVLEKIANPTNRED